MSDDQNNMPPVVQARPEALEHDSIMDQSLSDILKNNPEAKQKVMQAMGVSEEQLKTMLHAADGNELMHKNVGELFQSGFIQQAVKQTGQINPEQMQQVANIQPDGTGQQPLGETTQQAQTVDGSQEKKQDIGDMQISQLPFVQRIISFFTKGQNTAANDQQSKPKDTQDSSTGEQ